MTGKTGRSRVLDEFYAVIKALIEIRAQRCDDLARHLTIGIAAQKRTGQDSLVTPFLPQLMKLPLLCMILSVAVTGSAASPPPEFPKWSELPPLPNALGVAGPFAGIHKDTLFVGGGANFPKPIWESSKQWHDTVYVMDKYDDGYRWSKAGKLPQPTGYGATVSTRYGVICMGGNDASNTFSQVYELSWDRDQQKLTQRSLPSLPRPCAYGSATLAGNTIYLAGGQSGSGIDSAMRNFWSLDLTDRLEPQRFHWRQLAPWPGPNRAFNITVAAKNGEDMCVYVMSGRRQEGEDVQFLTDVWEYHTKTRTWRPCADMPAGRMAGIGAVGDSGEIHILGGADGSLWDKAPALGNNHPGFPLESYQFTTRTEVWKSTGAMPANHVTTSALVWDGNFIIPSGEIRPRVRSPKIWAVEYSSRRARLLELMKRRRDQPTR
jgi:SSS family solute:Na+ symporter